MSPSQRPAIRPLLQQYGIQHSYVAASGETVMATEDAALATVAALGADTAGDLSDIIARERDRTWSRLLEPVVLAWNGRLSAFPLRVSASAARRAIHYEVRLETGDVVSGTIPPSQRRERGTQTLGRARLIELVASITTRVPNGYHELSVRTADARGTALLIAAPRRCYSGDRPREWGVFAPLYALRESRAKAIGDFDDLQALMRWIGELDGDLVGTLPISAAFLREPFDPSPYSPASRLFWNELFLPGASAHGADGDLVDYRAVAEAKRAALEPVAQEFFRAAGEQSDRFHAFSELYPDARDYAAFRAAGEKFGGGWPTWSAHARAGELRPSDYDHAALEYHLYGQLATHEQLAALSRNCREAGVRLYLDLPLGVHPDSYDVWRNRELFVTGVSAGAPPDPFFTRGQNWGFPPMSPVTMREDRYTYWRKVLQTQLRYAGILRLDHVMSLHRLYVVPAGFEATDGVYVRYPADELYAVLALESERHEAAIVGEDLGTVPAEVRKSMDEHGVKRMFVVQFEAGADDPALAEIPASSVTSLNTHDMPPFRAYWEALDADLRHELGLIDQEGVDDARASRKQVATALSRQLGAKRRMTTEQARTALLEKLAESSADILLVNLEDLWLEEQPQNVPGTSQERPNWRRRLKYTLEEIRAHPDVLRLLASIENARRSPGGKA